MKNMTTGDFVDLFRRHIRGLREGATGELAGLCPFHDDTRASFAANRETGLWYCHACGAKGNARQFAERVGELWEGEDGQGRRIVATTYEYRDERGTLLFQVVRTDPKGFFQRRPDGRGGWINNLDGVRRVPYRLSDLARARQEAEAAGRPFVLYVVEGEADVDHLWRLGLPATCNPGGAGKWKPEHADLLVKRLGPVKIVILADNDDPGWKHALQVARSFWRKAEAIKVLLALPDIPEKGDVSDYLDRHSKEELAAVIKGTPLLTVEELERLEREHLQDPKVEELSEEDEEEVEPEPEALPPFPDAAWRGVFATYRQAMAGTSEAADSVHFSAIWTIAAVRLRRRIWVYYGYPLFPNVYIVNFGETGDTKTTAARRVLPLLPDDGRVKLLRGVGSAEALGDWLEQLEEGPKVSHLLFLEELSVLLTRGKWEGSTVVPFLTEAFDCPPVYEVPFRKKPIKVVEPTVSILSCTTPAWFWKGMREIDIYGGFGNRFLYLTGPPKAPIPMPKKPDPRLLEEVERALDGLDQLPSMEIALSPDTKEIWDGFYFTWRKTEWDPLTRAATKRVPAYILKLSMIYAALERTVPTITAAQLTAAIAVGHYAAKCADRLMGQHQGQTEEGRAEEAIRHFLRERGHTKRQLHQRLSGRVRATTFNRVLEAMIRTGEVQEIPGKRKGQVVLHLAGRRRP